MDLGWYFDKTAVRPTAAQQLVGAETCQRTRAATPLSLRAGGGACWEHAHMEPTASVDPSCADPLCYGVRRSPAVVGQVVTLGPLPGRVAKSRRSPPSQRSLSRLVFLYEVKHFSHAKVKLKATIQTY